MNKSKTPERVVVINDRSTAKGGATGLALLSVQLLRASGVPVVFICGDLGDNSIFRDLGVELVAIGGAGLLEATWHSSVRHGLYNARASSFIGEWIKNNDTQGTIYHLHSWNQILSPSIFSALSSVKERLVIHAHDFFLACPNGAYALFQASEPCSLMPLGLQCILTNCDRRSYAHKLWRVARQAIQRSTLSFHNGYPRVLTIHEAMRPLLERGGVPNQAIQCLPNPVRPWSFTRVIAEDNRPFLFVGRLNHEKGPDLAARATQIAGVPLWVIGDGPLALSLEKNFPHVRFLGRLGVDDISAFAQKTRALIMPSRYPEPYGLVAAEALWSGLPVILTKHALLAADIVARNAGVSYEPSNTQGLVDALCRLALDDSLVRNLSINAFENTRDLGLSPAHWVSRLMRVYSDM